MPPITGSFGALTARGFGLFSAPATVLDPYFPYVTMLLHGDGTNGAQNNTFLDSSTNNFSITRNGNTTQGSFSPYGSNWSNYFDGTGDYLTLANNSAFALPGDFTIEVWAYFNSNTTSVFCGNIDSSGYGDWAFFYNNAAGVRFLTDNGSTVITGTYTVTVGAWTHFAISRSGTSVKIFANGALLSTTTNSSSNTFAGTMYIGSSNNGGLQFPGYMSNLRIVKGTAVYTGAFTPPTTPLTAISGTSLLTCQSNRFKDNSTNAFAITRNGDTSVQRFSPFSPTAAYSTSTIGGSGYFDGTGDNLITATNAAFTFGTGDFQIEMWVYPTDAPAQFDCILNGLAGDGVFWGHRSGNLDFVNNNDTAGALSTAYPTLNTWTHVAVVRSGTTVSLYKNGVRQATATSSFNWAGTSFTVMSGGAASYYQGGYVSDVRILKGATTYTPSSTTITIPTAPLTAVSGTSLLLSCTNGAIFDNAMMNDLETVGDAQISTSVVKFGTGSLKFDGTGDYLKGPSSPNLGMGTGDFTVEAWVYINTATSYAVVVGGPSSDPTWYMEYSSNRGFYFYDGTSSRNGNSSVVTSQWVHLAVARSGTTLKMFVNGTVTATYTTSSSLPQIPIGVGSYNDGVSPLNGYIDDLRITKGYARYTSNFTPPIAAFPNN